MEWPPWLIEYRLATHRARASFSPESTDPRCRTSRPGRARDERHSDGPHPTAPTHPVVRSATTVVVPRAACPIARSTRTTNQLPFRVCAGRIDFEGALGGPLGQFCQPEMCVV